MGIADEDLIRKRLAERGIEFVDAPGVIGILAELMREQREDVLKKFREYADTLWEEGKKSQHVQIEKAYKEVCTELHRICQVAAGEEPLPAAGARLVEEGE